MALWAPLEARIAAGLSARAHALVELALETPPEARILVPERPEREERPWPSVRSLCFPRRFALFDPADGWPAEPGTYLLKTSHAETGPWHGPAHLVERKGELELWRADGAGR